MEAEERPQKLRKLSHDADRDIRRVGQNHELDSVIQPRRTSEDGDDREASSSDGGEEVADTPSDAITPALEADRPLSKNQLKKLKRREAWESQRDFRKVKRKQKMVEKKERKRAARAAQLGPQVPGQEVEGARGTNHPGGQDADALSSVLSRDHADVERRQSFRSTLLPVTIILDCQFNDLMIEKELISLGSQLTRCYSDNHHAPYKAHLVVSSWGGTLKERFDTVLSKQYKNWKGVRFLSENFIGAADKAKGWMSGPGGGSIAGTFTTHSKPLDPQSGHPPAATSTEDLTEGTSKSTTTNNNPVGAPGEIIYLTSDSPNTLTHLSPNSTYIVGGLVDKNRHKGICYKKARDAGADEPASIFRTAKLPIGEYMSMQSRSVLATNHVCEIMLRWLEIGDWGEAFVRVLPKRKGAVLKGKGGKADKEAIVEDEGREPVAEEEEEEVDDDDDDDGEMQLELKRVDKEEASQPAKEEATGKESVTKPL